MLDPGSADRRRRGSGSTTRGGRGGRERRDIEFRPGDEVFGGRTGACAEYVVAKSDRAIVKKPANVTFESAAAVPVAATTALQAIRDQGRLEAGQRVLVHGASGGVGTYAVQIAKALGGHVTAVCGPQGVEIARSLGADEVVDYSTGGRDAQRSPLRSRDRHRRDAVLPAAAARAHSAGDGRRRRGQEGEPPARAARPPGRAAGSGRCSRARRRRSSSRSSARRT